jgi:hypothetical protein
MMLLSVSIGLGRGADDWNVAQLRYFHYGIQVAPLLSAIYFAWEVFGQRPARGMIQNGICVLLAINFICLFTLIPRAENRRRQIKQFESDLAQGLTPSALYERHAELLWGGQLDHWQENRRGGAGRFTWSEYQRFYRNQRRACGIAARKLYP